MSSGMFERKDKLTQTILRPPPTGVGRYVHRCAA